MSIVVVSDDRVIEKVLHLVAGDICSTTDIQVVTAPESVEFLIETTDFLECCEGSGARINLPAFPIHGGICKGSPVPSNLSRIFKIVDLADRRSPEDRLLLLISIPEFLKILRRSLDEVLQGNDKLAFGSAEHTIICGIQIVATTRNSNLREPFEVLECLLLKALLYNLKSFTPDTRSYY